MASSDKPQRFYGTTIVAACFTIQGIGVGSFIACGVFFPSLLDAFGWSRTLISGVSSMAFLLMRFLGILMGALNDRFAPRIIMTGLVKVGTGAGQLIMPFLAGVCITRLSWRSAYGIIGLIVLVCIVFDMTGSYRLIFMALIGLAAVSLLLTLPLRPARS